MKHAARIHINALAASAGASWALVREHRHPRIAFTKAGKTVVLTIANSPSDRRALANLVADLRRAFRRWLTRQQIHHSRNSGENCATIPAFN